MKILTNNPKNKKCNDSSWCFRTMLLTTSLFCVAVFTAFAQTESKKIVVPDWALPASPTHKQVPPPSDFHRATITENKPIGIFKGQSDVGAALVPGSSSYNPKTREYTISSAGYNIWYNRDEFRYIWKKMSGDISLAADVKFLDEGYGDRKISFLIRQNLEDDAKEIMVTLHGAGTMHLVARREKGLMIKKVDHINKKAKRIGIEKLGDVYSLFLSMDGEPMQQVGDTMQLNLKEPFYVGIGFCSHQPDVVKTGVISNVVLENAAGKVR
jgi:hypothetical protein